MTVPTLPAGVFTGQFSPVRMFGHICRIRPFILPGVESIQGHPQRQDHQRALCQRLRQRRFLPVFLQTCLPPTPGSFWPRWRGCKGPCPAPQGALLFYTSDRRSGHKILCSSCTRSPITMGLDKKPFMPLSKALRRSSSKALAVMARIGSFARAGSSSARIFRVAV